MRARKINFVARKYGKSAKRIFFILLVIFVGRFIYSKIEDRGVFNITKYSYAGVVTFVNVGDFENVVKANIQGKSYFALSTTHLEEVLKNNFLAIKTVNIIKKPFNSIEINVQERVPVAIVVDNVQERFLIDEEGYVLGIIDNSPHELPTLNYENKLLVGKFIDKNIIPVALEILNSAKIENVEISSLSFKPDYASFYTSNAIVILGYTRQITESFKIIERLFEENPKITRIDLRYEKVIVSYE